MKHQKIKIGTSRRSFIKKISLCAVGAGFPTIIPSFVLGENAPSNSIQVGQIGFGRIGKSMDVPGILACDGVRMIALAELDQNRAFLGKEFIQKHPKNLSKNSVDLYDNYQEMLERKDIDAISISTPDHWHSQPLIEAVFSGKDVYVQKPISLTIEEGRLVSDAVRQTERIFLVGSQQRSMPQFHKACELVRNGRLGKVYTIEIGLPGDPAGGKPQEMPVPKNLNYDRWLGSTPSVYYTEDRVHSNSDTQLLTSY